MGRNDYLRRTQSPPRNDDRRRTRSPRQSNNKIFISEGHHKNQKRDDPDYDPRRGSKSPVHHSRGIRQREPSHSHEREPIIVNVSSGNGKKNKKKKKNRQFTSEPTTESNQGQLTSDESKRAVATPKRLIKPNETLAPEMVKEEIIEE